MSETATEETTTTEVAVIDYHAIARVRDGLRELKERVQEIIVDDDDSFHDMEGIQAKAEGFQNKVRELTEPTRAQRHAAYKAVTSLNKGLLDPAQEIADIAGRKTAKYLLDEQAEREREQAVLDKQVEAQHAADALEEAAIIEENSGKEAADAHLAEAATQEPTRITAASNAPTKRAGTGVRKTYGIKIVDASKVPDEYKIIDTKTLEGLARNQKERFKVDGVQLVVSAKTSVRAAK